MNLIGPDPIISDSIDPLPQGIEDAELFLQDNKNDSVIDYENAAETQETQKNINGDGGQNSQESAERFESLFPLAFEQLLDYCGKCFCAISSAKNQFSK